MHEFSIMVDMLQIVTGKAAEHKLQSIKKIVLAIGELTCLNKEALEYAFTLLQEGTIAEGADLKIVIVEATACCNNCRHAFPISHINKVCPECGQSTFQVNTGYEIILEEVEGELYEENIG